jgi:hypothetical protein
LSELNVKVNKRVNEVLHIQNARSLKEEVVEFLGKFSF